MRRPLQFWVGLALGAMVGLSAAPRLAHALSQTDSAAKASAPFFNPGPMAPGIPTKQVMAGSASVDTSPGAGLCLRISCTVGAAYRVGVGAQTATVDDNQLPANTPERVCLGPTQTDIAYFTTSAGSCYTAVYGT